MFETLGAYLDKRGWTNNRISGLSKIRYLGDLEQGTAMDQFLGLLVVSVPPSELRPHMSIPEHRYFRRGSDGTCILEHGEVRDLMLAPKIGVLDLAFVSRTGSRSGFNFEVRVHLILRTVGTIPVWARYVYVSGTNLFAEASLKELVLR